MTHQDALNRARALALVFVRTEAGFAQVTTIGRGGLPVGRTMSAFLAEDWSIELVQRRLHHRMGQLQRDPSILVTWVGPPAESSTNEHPHVFDLGLLIPRAVFVQGHAEPLSEQQTWDSYAAHTGVLRAAGHHRAPQRSREDVADQLAGLRVQPARVRLEGFGDEAETFDWNCQPTTHEDEART